MWMLKTKLVETEVEWWLLWDGGSGDGEMLVKE